MGIAAAVPASIGIGLARYGAFAQSSGTDTGSVVILGAILGMVSGNQYWKANCAESQKLTGDRVVDRLG